MPKDFFLTDIKKGTICAYKQDEKSICSNTKQLFMSRSGVSKYLKNSYLYVVKKRSNHPPRIANTDRCRLFQELSKGQFCSKNTVQ